MAKQKRHESADDAQSHRSRREFLWTSGLGALSLGALPLVGGCGDDPAAQEAEDEVFTLVALPDTQHYADSYPEVFEAQTRWIVDNLETEQIKFVTHLGDIVDNGPNLRQWKNARKAMDLLDKAGVPYGTCVGNHDVMYNDNEYQFPAGVDSSCASKSQVDCSGKDYLTQFNPKRYAGKPWFGGASPSGLSNYQLLTVGGIKFLFLHLSVDPRKAERAWAQKVLDGHKDAAVHLSTHRYMYDYRLVKTLPSPLNQLLGGRFDTLSQAMGQNPYFGDALTCDQLFKQLIAPNPNIFMVQCGHVDAELRQISKNSAGLPIHELLVDFQTSEAKGGNGWMRLMKFNLTRGTIKVRTYSPTLKRYRKNGEGVENAFVIFNWIMKDYSQYFAAVGLDQKELQKQLDYWEKDKQGRAEFAKMLMSDGRRDSEFELAVDFSAYTK